MLRDERVAVLSDFAQLIMFADDTKGEEGLIVESHVPKDGDLYWLTPRQKRSRPIGPR